jgi:hypothetical protein
VVIKHTFDGFLRTDLDGVLRSRGVRSLLVAGLVTSTCVLFTASTATRLGYLVSVVSDCCADQAPAHDATLAAYPYVFGTVRSDQIADRRPPRRMERRSRANAPLRRDISLRPHHPKVGRTAHPERAACDGACPHLGCRGACDGPR